jgi:hypothetical protein
LAAAFKEKQIAAEPCRVEAGQMSLVALQIEHNSIPRILACAKEYAEKTGQVLQARRDDANGKAHPIDVTEKNIRQAVMADKGNLHLFLFREKDEDQTPEQGTQG